MKIKDQMEKEIYKMRESFGDKDPLQCKVTGKNWNNDLHNNAVQTCLTIRRLAKKHHRLAEMDCNGEGNIRGQHYYNGTIDDYARREYGQNVQSAYRVRSGTLDDPKLGEEITVFDIESEKVQDKIIDLVKQLGKDWRVEFQGDPRGNTVKLFFKDRYIDINF